LKAAENEAEKWTMQRSLYPGDWSQTERQRTASSSQRMERRNRSKSIDPRPLYTSPQGVAGEARSTSIHVCWATQ